MIQPPVEKILRLSGIRIGIAEWYFKVLHFFKDFVRPALQPQVEVEALWINRLGQSLGILCCLFLPLIVVIDRRETTFQVQHCIKE